MAARPASRAAPSARPVHGRAAPDPRQPREPTEDAGQLKKSAKITLNSAGGGTVTFTPYNARQRWEVDQVTVSTDQAATAIPVPVAEVFVNATSSRGNSEGSTSSGSQDVLSGLINVGPCDQLHIVWTDGIPGTVATAVVTGSYYTRRS